MTPTPNPHMAGTVWLKKSWKLNNNPFPTTGIARLGGNDKRENGLLYDPAVIKHPEVNAFQRYSSVILQRSTREGFGLTVTEAMWKYQPVIGTSVTGLRTQIIDGQNGYIADDTEACAKYTLKLIQDRELWRKLGEQAHERVKNNYLFPTMILQYLDALIKARGMSHLLPAWQTLL